MVLEEEEEIDLSDIEEIPLTTATKFSTHKTVILEDKDGMLSHKSHTQVCPTMTVSFSSFVDFSCALVWRWCNRNFPKVTLSVRRQIISPTRSPV